MYPLEIGNFAAGDKDPEREAQFHGFDKNEKFLIPTTFIDCINDPILWCTYVSLKELSISAYNVRSIATTYLEDTSFEDFGPNGSSVILVEGHPFFTESDQFLTDESV